MAMTQIELWSSAAAAFEARHQLVEDRHRSLPTPCSEFDVAALIEHAVSTQVTFGQVFGSTAVEGATWSEARAALAAALEIDGSVDGVIDHPALGEVSKERMLAIATNDMLIHTWDLARAIGADETLPEENLQPAIEGIEAFPSDARSALFAPPLDGESTNLQNRMLAVAGRTP